MIEGIIRLVVYLASLTAAMIALSGVRLSAFFKKGKVMEVQLFYLLCSMALGYLVAEFLLGLRWNQY